MRVSLINQNLMGGDAIGACMINQVRFFTQRGDDVRVYVLDAPRNMPAEVAALAKVITLRDLLDGRQKHFRLSDLYIYHYPGRHPLMESIRGIERGTVIFNYHNVTPPELWGSNIGREWLQRSVEGSGLVHYADLCIVDSPFNKQDLVDRLIYDPDRIHVLPLAVELEEFTPGEEDPRLVRRLKLQDHKVLLFVGRMAGNKRIDLLIEALARIKERIPNTKLLLVGDDRGNPAFPYVVAAARSRAVELNVEPDVIWTGRVDSVAPYFRLADVYVTASLHEGFGVPLIEAMATGIPVVASRSGAMPWVLDDAGLVCDPGDADDLAEKVLAVLTDDQLREELVERGFQRVQAFSVEQYEANWAAVLDQALPDHWSDAGAGRVAREGKVQADSVITDMLSRVNDKTLVDEIWAYGDVAMRDYVVRSSAPVVGPWIVWVRRNLTSHLREPYLDLIIEKQVSFNRRVAEWIRRATGSWAAMDRRQSELEDRVKALEAQVEALLRQQGEKGSVDD
jgi:glycosyltransferase involved in cell wall biosynthesis